MNTSPLYVSDLDGTLLQADARLSDFALAQLTSMIEEGLCFTVASARSVETIRQVLRGLPLRLPVVSFNGAFLSDLATGRHYQINAMPTDVAHAVHDVIADSGFEMLISTCADRHADHVYYRGAGNAGMQFYLEERQAQQDARMRHTGDYREAMREEVVCITVIGPQAPLAQLEATMQAVCGTAVRTHLVEDLYLPGWFWLTAHDQRATKDRGLALLREQCRLADRQLVVFGDQINDLPMFAAADRAIAVANADPLVLAAAHERIGPNHEDSVVQRIAQEWQARHMTSASPVAAA